MGRTAGTGIISRNTDNADLTLDLDLTAVDHGIQLLLSGIQDFYGDILCHCLIGFPLDPAQLFPGKRAVIIHGHSFISQMKSHIPVTEMPVYDPGYNVLSRMLLHFGKTLLKIQYPRNSSPGLCRYVRTMKDNAVLLSHIQNTGLPPPGKRRFCQEPPHSLFLYLYILPQTAGCRKPPSPEILLSCCLCKIIFQSCSVSIHADQGRNLMYHTHALDYHHGIIEIAFPHF